MIYEPEKGVNFWMACKQCKEHAYNNKLNSLPMLFNEIEITVNVDSNIDDLSVIYDLKKVIAKNKISVYE